MRIEYPSVFDPFFKAPKRYNVGEGGRGRGASWTIARKFVSEAAFSKNLYLCTREYQNSIKDSVHRLLVEQIDILKLNNLFEVQKDMIYSKMGSEFIFKGLQKSITEIKSLEGVRRCWVEEAEKTSDYSWSILIPTIRTEGSEFYISYNPEEEESSTYQRFHVHPPPDSNIIQSSYKDNPWFPEVLRREMEYCKRVDYEAYMHIWEGQIKRYADSLVLRGKFVVEEFETPEDAEFLFGADFGYSEDPSALVRCFIKDRKLFVDYEAGGVGIEIDELPTLYRSIPGTDRWCIRADSARPDTISYIANRGFNVIGAEKGPGSIEDGIQFLRQFEAIVIHTRCPQTLANCKNYRWKVDRNTKLIQPIPVDSFNDFIDSLRYAIEPFSKNKVSILDTV